MPTIPTQALVFLEAAAPYELGEPPQLQVGTLYPTYIRGQAQLIANNGPCRSRRIPEAARPSRHRAELPATIHSTADLGRRGLSPNPIPAGNSTFKYRNRSGTRGLKMCARRRSNPCVTDRALAASKQLTKRSCSLCPSRAELIPTANVGTPRKR